MIGQTFFNCKRRSNFAPHTQRDCKYYHHSFQSHTTKQLSNVAVCGLCQTGADGQEGKWRRWVVNESFTACTRTSLASSYHDRTCFSLLSLYKFYFHIWLKKSKSLLILFEYPEVLYYALFWRTKSKRVRTHYN